MKWLLAAVLLSLSLSLNCVSAQSTRITLCGRQLAEARALLCYGAENVVNKRNTPSNYILDSSEDNHEVWLWSHRGPMTAWPRNKRQGIADQCCIKSCTQEDILSYC